MFDAVSDSLNESYSEYIMRVTNHPITEFWKEKGRKDVNIKTRENI